MNGTLIPNLLNKITQQIKLPFLAPYSHTARTPNSQSTSQALILPLTSLQCGSILQSLTNSKSIKQGQSLHAHIISSGLLQYNTYLSTKLVAFYANCGYMGDAQMIFDQIALKNSFLWNSMVRGYACSGFPIRAIEVYLEMLCSGQKPDNFTYPFVVKPCGDLMFVETGRIVHCAIVISGLESDVYVANGLLGMYMKFGDTGKARLVFDRMSNRDLTSWNTLILGYVKNGCFREGLKVLALMQRSGFVPDCTTLLSIISAFADLEMAKQGKAVHGYVVRNDLANFNNHLINALIEMYCNCKLLVNARRLFDISLKDTVSWNSLIWGYSRNGECFEALRFFCKMLQEDEVPDLATLIAVLEACEHSTALNFGMSVHSYLVQKGYISNTMAATALISMYSKCGSLDLSVCVFDEMEDKNLVSWTAMLSAYGFHGKGREAVCTFQEMLANNIIPDEGALTAALMACSHAGLVEEAQELFHLMRKKYNMKPGLALYSCLVDLLGRAGHLDEAYEIIRNMEPHPTGDIWASFLSACRVHGNAYLADLCAQEIFEAKPQGIGSYICLSHIYATEERWDDVQKVRRIITNQGLTKLPGHSSIGIE